MNQEPITPVRHGVVSSATGTTAGAVGGGIRSGVKTFLYTAAIGAAIGAFWLATGGIGALGTTVGVVMAKIVGGALLGGVAGALIGSFIAPFTGLFGAATGGSRAATRIREERGAANMLDAQLSAYQAQAYAMQAQPATIYAPSAANNNSFPAQGSPMNPASPQIAAGSAQNLGTINGQQLQIA